MRRFYSTKKSRVTGLQPSFGVLECPLYSSSCLISVLKVSPPLSPPLKVGNPALKNKSPRFLSLPCAKFGNLPLSHRFQKPSLNPLDKTQEHKFRLPSSCRFNPQIFTNHPFFQLYLPQIKSFPPGDPLSTPGLIPDLFTKPLFFDPCAYIQDPLEINNYYREKHPSKP